MIVLPVAVNDMNNGEEDHDVVANIFYLDQNLPPKKLHVKLDSVQHF